MLLGERRVGWIRRRRLLEWRHRRRHIKWHGCWDRRRCRKTCGGHPVALIRWKTRLKGPIRRHRRSARRTISQTWVTGPLWERRRHIVLWDSIPKLAGSKAWGGCGRREYRGRRRLTNMHVGHGLCQGRRCERIIRGLLVGLRYSSVGSMAIETCWSIVGRGWVTVASMVGVLCQPPKIVKRRWGSRLKRRW